MAYLLLALLSLVPLWGQSEAGGGTINGVVLDPSGAAVPGARITVQSADTGLSRRVETEGAGLFTFVRLPAGRYAVRYKRTAFGRRRRKRSP